MFTRHESLLRVMPDGVELTSGLNTMRDEWDAVVGLGYVELPLTTVLEKIYSTIGFDLSQEKGESHKHLGDTTREVSKIFGRRANSA